MMVQFSSLNLAKFYSRKILSFVLTIPRATPIRSKTIAPATRLKIKLDKDGVIENIRCYFNKIRINELNVYTQANLTLFAFV